MTKPRFEEKRMKQLTAEELLKSIYDSEYRSSYKTQYSEQCIKKAMIEFAKLHVEDALKAAKEQANYPDINGNFDSILNAYPLDLIK
jgi:ribosome maturation protein Sdo1